jgi:predicted nuclease of predicted toxin-antitoxin system
MKLLIDMNLSPRWIETLAGAGIEAVHWSTVGAKDAPDEAIMAFAKENGYVVFTHDLGFGAMLAVTHDEKPSIVQIRTDDVSPDAIGQALINALMQMAAELENGALLTVDLKRARLRVLPLRQE